MVKKEEKNQVRMKKSGFNIVIKLQFSLFSYKKKK